MKRSFLPSHLAWSPWVLPGPWHEGRLAEGAVPVLRSSWNMFLFGDVLFWLCLLFGAMALAGSLFFSLTYLIQRHRKREAAKAGDTALFSLLVFAIVLVLFLVLKPE